jgi:hypothetical protein
MLTFEALSETAEFARKWVPFCNKFNIEPRAPEFYFSLKVDYLRDKVQPTFVQERRAMKVRTHLRSITTSRTPLLIALLVESRGSTKSSRCGSTHWWRRR